MKIMESDRRTVLKVVALGAAATSAVLAAAPAVASERGAGASESTLFAAVGEIVAKTTETLTLATRQEWLAVTPVEGARMYSGAYGAVSNPSQFVVGDRVLVRGKKAGAGAVDATAIGSVFTDIAFDVQSDPADTLVQTSFGDVDFSGALAELGRIPRSWRRGRTVHGLVWREPKTGAMYLVVSDADAVRSA